MGGTLPSNVIFDECFNAVRGLPSCGQGNADCIFAQLKGYKRLAVQEFTQAIKVTGDFSPNLHKSYDFVPRAADTKDPYDIFTDSYFSRFFGEEAGILIPEFPHTIRAWSAEDFTPSRLAPFHYTTIGQPSASCSKSCHKTRGGKRHSKKSKKIEKSAGQINIFFGNLSSWSVHAEDYVNGLTDDIILLA